ncbi:hypothetical protein EBB05_13580 [Methylobacterium brachiatum]|nr:hypothetical protein EBB05_13580 [Methylobacterium brachiatum]
MRMTENADDEITWLVLTLAEEADVSGAAVGLMVERLRRMEDEARLGGADSQTLQRIMSGRRVLGDRVDFGLAPRVPGDRQGVAEGRRGS